MPLNMREVMELQFENEPGTVFQYKPDPQIIVYLLEEVYGLPITDLLQIKLISHLKNDIYEWDRDDIQGMKVSLQLLSEFGQLILNRGTIYGKRLFSEEYYYQMITEYSSGGLPECMPYGLSWWIAKDTNIPYFCACGFGGQILTLVPSKKVSISILSDMDRPHPENNELLKTFLNRIDLLD